jgi:hypothetical protein
VNSQNRMNAGAEYVVYRIWATLLDEHGIHPESLLTCLGALAGYACQVSVRHAGPIPSLESAKTPLLDSPLSVWALCCRTVQKFGEPLPDLEDILTYVNETAGATAFRVPRAPAGHHPRHSAHFYLEQIWPQILPIAQRFCRKPAQLPILFGIALQRAIEQTQATLHPTVGASIAMECAVAASRVSLALPGTAMSDPLSDTATHLPVIVPPPPLSGKPQATAKRGARRIPASARKVGALIGRIPPTAQAITIVALAFVAVAGTMWKPSSGGGAQNTPRAELVRTAFAAPNVEAPVTSETFDQQAQDAPVATAAAPEAAAERTEIIPPDPFAEEEERQNAENQRQLDASSADGSAESAPPPGMMSDFDPGPLS